MLAFQARQVGSIPTWGLPFSGCIKERRSFLIKFRKVNKALLDEQPILRDGEHAASCTW